MTSEEIREQVQSATKTIAKKDTVEGQTLGVLLSIFGQLATLNVQLGEINAKTPALRDQLAMAALQGVLARPDGPSFYGSATSAAYVMADEMLKAREGKQ